VRRFLLETDMKSWGYIGMALRRGRISREFGCVLWLQRGG
jgi:hypothetical protein